MAKKPSYEELQKQVEALKQQAQNGASGELTFQIGAKGGVSVYGLGRFPLTLYYEQWKRLIPVIPRLEKFLELNKSKLKLKGDK